MGICDNICEPSNNINTTVPPSSQIQSVQPVINDQIPTVSTEQNQPVITEQISPVITEQISSVITEQIPPVEEKKEPTITKNKEEKFKKFISKKSFEAHEDNIVCLIELKNKKIMSGSYDKTIKIWDLNNSNCDTIIHEDECIICLLEFEPNMLLSGTQSETIRLWDITKPEKKICSFLGHSLYVFSKN